jgi:hypothetical protein
MIHTGTYARGALAFNVGDFVYLRKHRFDDMDVATRRTILRVLAVGSLGLITLEDGDGATCKRHVRDLAPCHLTDIDPVVVLAEGVGDIPCEVCR